MTTTVTTVTYPDLIAIARDLTEGGDDSEYTRGIIELLRDAFGYMGVDGETRCEQIAADIRGPVGNANPAIRQALEAIWAVLPEEPNRTLGIFDLLADIDRANTDRSETA